MKKITLIALAILGISFASAQENKTSLTAGYTNATLKSKVEVEGESTSDDVSGGGFFIGINQELTINDKVAFKPGLIYSSTTLEDADDNLETLQIPLFFKFKTSNKFSLLAGPKLDYLLNVEEEEKDMLNKLSFALGFGAEVELNDSLSLVVNYSLQLTNSLTDEFEDAIKEELSEFGISDIEATIKQNYFNIGLAYNF